jgi:hypothetical protein
MLRSREQRIDRLEQRRIGRERRNSRTIALETGIPRETSRICATAASCDAPM